MWTLLIRARRVLIDVVIVIVVVLVSVVVRFFLVVGEEHKEFVSYVACHLNTKPSHISSNAELVAVAVAKRCRDYKHLNL